MSLILTKAALALKNADSNFQFVKYEAHKPKEKKAVENQESEPKSQNRKKDLELKKIRHEVVKFGMSGFDGTKKQEAKIALAVSLGAKPPRRPYVNYKELMQKRKLEKQQESEQQQQMMAKIKLQSGGKKKKKGVSNDVGHLLSSYGKVQKKDLKKGDKDNKKKKKKK